MRRYAIVMPALAMLAACGDTIVDPVLTQDVDPAAVDAAAMRVGSSPGDPLATGASAASVVIDFESLTAAGPSFTYVASHSEDGFTVTNPDYPENDAFGAPQTGSTLYQGSTALVNNIPGDVTLLTKDDGGTFTAVSIDIAELAPTNPRARDVPFTGTRADGSTVMATLTTDGAAGFETFTFDGFTDLVSLSWVQLAPFHQFDNITLAVGGVAPATRDDCRNGGWESFGFKNQGQCIRMVETGKDSR